MDIEELNKVKIGILKNSDYYWNLIIDDGTARFILTLNHGEMKKLAESIPEQFKNASE